MERRGEQPRPDYQIILADFQRARERFEQDNNHGTMFHFERRRDDLMKELEKPGQIELGEVAWTQGAQEAMYKGFHLPAEFLIRHKHLDHGKLDGHDIMVNRAEVLKRGRILSIYETRAHEDLWVITDQGWLNTTLLRPGEY